MPDPHLSDLQSTIENLSARVAELDERLRALEHNPAEARKKTVAASPDSANESTLNPGLKIINRIGAITLAIGFVFFFKYAVDNSWIGASGRVFLGACTGLFQIALAEWLRRRNQLVFSQGLAGCGLATLYISIYAASVYYVLLSQPVAFMLLVAACALASPLSFLYGNPTIAALGLTGGFLTPPLLSNSQAHPWILFSYLLLLDLGSLAVAARGRWVLLKGLAFAGTAILFAAAIAGYHAPHPAALIFLPIFFAIFFASSLNELPWLAWLNAFWCLICFWILLDQKYPGSFALVCFGLAACHGIASQRNARQALRSGFYMIAHACAGIGVLRLLALWAIGHSSPLTRASLVSELDSTFLALYAVLMIALAVARRSVLDRAIGLTVLGIVITKLYLYDVWRLDRFYCISAFVGLGVLLLAASFVYSRFRSRPSSSE